MLDEQLDIANENVAFYQATIKELQENYRVAAKAKGAEEAAMGVVKLGLSSILLLEGFSAKALGMAKNGRVVSRFLMPQNSVFKFIRKTMLIVEEVPIYLIAPFLIGGTKAPRQIGVGLGKAIVGALPLEEQVELDAISLMGFQTQKQWNAFEETLRADLHAFYDARKEIFEERLQYDELLKGTFTQFFFGRGKRLEYYQKLYEASQSHLQVYRYQRGYLKAVKQKLLYSCNLSSKDFSIPTRTPYIFKPSQVYTENEYLKNAQKIPAWVKKALNRFELYSLSKVKETGEKIKNSSWVPSELKVFVDVLIELVNVSELKEGSEDSLKQVRLNQLLERLRPYVVDPEMKDCYRVTLTDASFSNAMNIGCDIYVSNTLVDELNDNQLLSVLAHELSHGDHGHLANNVLLEGKSFKEYIVGMLTNIADEYATGEVLEYLRLYRENGHIMSFVNIYSQHAPDIEIQADQGGVIILERAGIDRKYAKQALAILHGYKGDVDNSDEMLGKLGGGDSKGVRSYPGLFKRIQGINAVEHVSACKETCTQRNIGDFLKEQF